METERFAEGEL